MLKATFSKVLHGSQGKMLLAVDLEVQKGEFLAIMGKSGSGKITLLRILAGLGKAQGEVYVEGVSWKDMPIQKRDIGFVFQDYALFENMNVEENLLYIRADRVLADELLEMTELSTLRTRDVNTLSGGQKQRVSLCRAMMNRPKLLLMDEPLSALDEGIRSKLQAKIKALHLRFGTTTIIVSHDKKEVLALASRVCILEEGKIIQDGDVVSILAEDRGYHLVEVLRIISKEGIRYGIVWVNGLMMHIELDTQVECGESIKINIRGERQK